MRPVVFGNFNCRVHFVQHPDCRLDLYLYDETALPGDEPLAKATVNTGLNRPGGVWIDDTGSNRGILKALVKSGLLEFSGMSLTDDGGNQAHLCWINRPDGKKIEPDYFENN